MSGSTASALTALGATPGSSFFGAGGTGASGWSGTSATSAGGATPAANGPQVKQLETSRPWIATKGKKARRFTTLTFVLSKRAKVVLTVKRLSPDCQTVARFTVRGKKGVNRIRLTTRIGGKRLTPGTYRISASTRTGLSVRRLVLVVVDGQAPLPTPAEVAGLRQANVCSPADEAAEFALTGAVDVASALEAGLAGPAAAVIGSGGGAGASKPSANGPFAGSSPSLGGVLDSQTAKDTARVLQPALLALLAAAIVLLGLASTQRVAIAGPRVNDALARHRLEIAGVGAAALIGVILSFLVA